jgi:hypothetical protein
MSGRLTAILIGLCSSLLCSSLATAAADDEAYFQQFIYRKESTSQDPDYPSFVYRLLGSLPNIHIPIGNNQELQLVTAIKMNANHTYTMLYTDRVKDPNSSTWFPRACNSVTGQWSVPGKSLILTDENGHPILQGDRFFADYQYEVQMTYLPAFPISELRGKQSPYALATADNDPILICP